VFLSDITATNICQSFTYNTHQFNGPLSGTTRVSRYQKGETNLDFTEARDSEWQWQWHQLGHMQVCTSLQTDNHASTPPLGFSQAGCPSRRPTNSVEALLEQKPAAMKSTSPSPCAQRNDKPRGHCSTLQVSWNEVAANECPFTFRKSSAAAAAAVKVCGGGSVAARWWMERSDCSSSPMCGREVASPSQQRCISCQQSSSQRAGRSGRSPAQDTFL